VGVEVSEGDSEGEGDSSSDGVGSRLGSSLGAELSLGEGSGDGSGDGDSVAVSSGDVCAIASGVDPKIDRSIASGSTTPKNFLVKGRVRADEWEAIRTPGLLSGGRLTSPRQWPCVPHTA
jgi:hypothetical protein